MRTFPPQLFHRPVFGKPAILPLMLAIGLFFIAPAASVMAETGPSPTTLSIQLTVTHT